MAQMFVDDDLHDRVDRVLDSGRFIKGPEAEALGEEFAAFQGCDHGVAVSNGTSALYLAYHALGVRPGDDVIVPSHTFVATAMPLLHLGARPVFADIDPATYTLDPDDVAERITEDTAALTAVHLYGHATDMDPLLDLAEDHDLAVVEDCAQAHGAEYKGQRVGGLGDAGTWSFYPGKNMTVGGDGGAVTTNHEDVARTIEALVDQGRLEGKKYEHDLVGLNFRLSEALAAFGRGQLEHLPEWTTARRRNAELLRKGLAGLDGLAVCAEAPWARHVYHQFVVRTPRRDALAEHLDGQGISTGVHYPIPVHEQPAIVETLGEQPPLPRTEAAAREVLSLPVHPFLQEDDVHRVVDAVRSFMEGV